MSGTAIRVEKLSKRYRIGVRREDTLRDRVATVFRRPNGTSLTENGELADFWALRDVSFTVGRGDVIGIIGRNGAGKSTLLKVLSRITEPTTGRVELHGRVGSLLEVGTGFHPELSGRENIYLSGAILGMRRREIDLKFQEIVEFAEIERFLDTPVKRYSSGMYVRLAFAVAAHLEPEILIVDEVLAVGDTAFQRKCLGKMNEVSGAGRTVIFVSHNIAAVQSLCTRGLFINSGKVVLDGTMEEAVSCYLRTLEMAASQTVDSRTERGGRGQARITSISLSRIGSEDESVLATGQPAHFTFQFSPALAGAECTFTLYDHYGSPVANFDSAQASPDDTTILLPTAELRCVIDELLLVPGRYRLNAALRWNNEVQDHVEGAAIVDVVPGCVRGRAVQPGGRYGSVFIPHRWLAATPSPVSTSAAGNR